jgi:argonaute-like protein
MCILVLHEEKRIKCALMAFDFPWQGTTKPTHYHVLCDEMGFSPDDLQELVHSLSYV